MSNELARELADAGWTVLSSADGSSMTLHKKSGKFLMQVHIEVRGIFMRVTEAGLYSKSLNMWYGGLDAAVESRDGLVIRVALQNEEPSLFRDASLEEIKDLTPNRIAEEISTQILQKVQFTLSDVLMKLKGKA